MNTERYSRNLAVKGFTPEMQETLFTSRVLVVGAGGLGSAVLHYLVSAGVGHIAIVEYDTVGESNLQRQILYSEADLGKNKGEVAKARLTERNSECEIIHHNTRFTEENGYTLASGYDLIADCSDNYAARYAMDKVSQQLGLPFVYATAEQTGGQISTFNYKGGMSYTDLFAEPPAPNSETIGVLSPLPGIVGSLEALEIIKILTGFGTNLSGKLLTIDTHSYETAVFEF